MKKILIVILILLSLGVVLYLINRFENSNVSIQERCRRVAQSEYEQGVITGPDAIGNSIEHCLTQYNIDPNI